MAVAGSKEIVEARGIIQLLQKAYRTREQDWSKDELLDAIHWQRQILGLVCGIIWGAIPLTGFLAFASFVALNVILLLSWWRAQRIDEEEYGSLGLLIGEGLPPSVGLFVFVWILVYTATSH